MYIIMKNLKVLIGTSALTIMLILSSCQKDLLPNAQSSLSGKKLSISTDSSKVTLLLTTDTTASQSKAKKLTVDWLKTFSPVAGDHDYFILKSNTSWQIVSNPSWLTVSPLSGTG